MAEDLQYEEFECLDEYLDEIQEESLNEEILVEEETIDKEEHDVTFFTTANGNLKLSYDSYVYNHEKTSGIRSYFHCINKHLGCKSRVTVVTEENGVRNVFPPKVAHNHMVKPLKTASDIALSNFRKKSATDGSRPCHIISEFHADPENRYLNAILPSKTALAQRIRRTRVKINQVCPPEPDSSDFK